MRKTDLTRSLAVACFGGIALLPLASAQVCSSGSATLNGAYGFVATQFASSGAAPRTGFSSSEIGTLLSGIAGSGAFSAVGFLNFDGAGGIFATSSPTGGFFAQVGTYTVNTDCTVAATLTDPMTFGGTNRATSSLQGVVLGGGSEVDFEPVPATGTTTNFSLVVRLFRPLYPSGCTTANLIGPYGLVTDILFQTVPVNPPGTGNVAILSAPVNPPGSGNIPTVARVRFDGGGSVVADPIVTGSPLGSLQLTGTYTVNTDCTGTMTLANPPTTGTITPPAVTTFVINFILTQPSVSVSLGAPNLTGLSANQLRPGIVFGLSNARQTAFGYGRAQ